MATTRATGYVVTAAVWNAVLSGLSDAGVFTGTITTSGTATFNGDFAAQGGNPAVFYTPSSGSGIRIVGRSSDNIGGIQFTNSAQTTEYFAVSGRSTGAVFDTGSTSRTFTFTGGRVNSNTVQPAVFAYHTSDVTTVTNGTTITLGTEWYDQGGNFASNVFTAPVTGHYLVSGAVTVTNTSGSAGDVAIEVRTAAGDRINGSAMQDVPNSTQVTLTMPAVVVPLAASDAVRIVYTGAAQVTVNGELAVSAVYTRTYFCVRLLI